MTEITNNTNLYEAVVDTARKTLTMKEHPSNEFYIGELSKSVQELVLSRKNGTSMDASDSFVKILRSMFRMSILENAGFHYMKTPLKGMSLFLDDNHELKSSVDFYDEVNKELVAVKVGKVYGYKTCKDGSDKTYYNEMLLNSIMMKERLGITPEKMTILYGILDHSVTEACTKEDYPEHEIMTITWDVPNLDKDCDLIKECLNKMEMVTECLDGKREVPPCTAEERWAKVSYALKKPANKTNTCKGSLEKITEAWHNLKDKDKEVMEAYRIESYSKNCFHYCPFANKCPQHKTFLDNGGKMEDTMVNITDEFKASLQ